jgi:outer membrane biosynthesis protein TonB
MSKQEIRLELVKSKASGTVVVAVSGLAPIPLSRKGKSVCRPAGEFMRVRTTVDEAAADKLLLAQELFSGVMRERWSDWFEAADEDILEDASEPVVAINRRGERTVTLLADGAWPDDEDEVSVRLTRAVFDGTGLAVVWTVRSTKPPAPEPVPEPEPEAAVEPDAEPVAEAEAESVADVKEDEKRLLKARKAKKNDKRAKAIAAALAAALNFDSDSDADEA